MKKKKVLFLITKSSWGGAQRYVFDLATNVDTKTYEPVVALGGTDELFERLRESKVRVVSIKGLGRDVSIIKDLMASLHIVYILFTERPTVLHVNSSKVGGLGTFFGRLLLIRNVIFTSHGWAFNENRPGWQRVIIKCLQWVTVLFSHQTIVVSAALKKDMDWPLVQSKMTVVPLGREVGTVLPRAAARAHLADLVSSDIHQVWLGSIAELHPTKCLDVAIKAVAKLKTDFPQLTYVIIHDGEERARLAKLVNDLDLTQNVFFAGTIPEAASLLSAFDLFVLPSRSEAFGYVLVEAGLAKLPVVATRVGGIPEVINDQETGVLVAVNDVDELAGAIRSLLTDPALAQRYAQAHHERSKEFSLANMLTATKAVYDQR